jgi:hypothetical protein
MSTEVLKRKCSSFFKPNDRIIIKTVVKQVHNRIVNATHLLKAYCLYKGDEVTIIDVDVLESCCLIVAGKTKPPTERNTKQKDREISQFEELLTFYNSRIKTDLEKEKEKEKESDEDNENKKCKKITK